MASTMEPMACPVCGRMDGGHNADMHAAAGKPVPAKKPSY